MVVVVGRRGGGYNALFDAVCPESGSDKRTNIIACFHSQGRRDGLGVQWCVIVQPLPNKEVMPLMQFLTERVSQTGQTFQKCSLSTTWILLSTREQRGLGQDVL